MGVSLHLGNTDLKTWSQNKSKKLQSWLILLAALLCSTAYRSERNSDVWTLVFNASEKFIATVFFFFNLILEELHGAAKQFKAENVEA